MPDRHDVAVLVGSLRRQAYSRRLAEALMRRAPAALNPQIVEIGELPFFNQDLEETPAQAWVTFRERIQASAAVLFVTPEYNRSVPAVLKNAVDVASRPRGKSVWNGKPAAVISISPGQMGGFAANHHLRQSLMAVNVAVMPGPEVYLNGADRMFDANGEPASEQTHALLVKFMEGFERWIARNPAPQPA